MDEKLIEALIEAGRLTWPIWGIVALLILIYLIPDKKTKQK